MTHPWNRWNINDNVAVHETIEIIYVDDKNQICYKIEKTKQLEWQRTSNLILGWRPLLCATTLSSKPTNVDNNVIVGYWNYMTKKLWSNPKTPPNPKLPNYLKVIMTLNNGKTEITYEKHSIY